MKTLIRRVLQSRGMDYWESGMDLKLGDDIYDSFRAYQRALLREYASMADEFDFRVLDARRKVDVIQDELRRQIGAFLAENDPARRRRRPAESQRLHDGDRAELMRAKRVYTEFTQAKSAGNGGPLVWSGWPNDAPSNLHAPTRRPDPSTGASVRAICRSRSMSRT